MCILGLCWDGSCSEKISFNIGASDGHLFLSQWGDSFSSHVLLQDPTAHTELWEPLSWICPQMTSSDHLCVRYQQGDREQTKIVCQPDTEGATAAKWKSKTPRSTFALRLQDDHFSLSIGLGYNYFWSYSFFYLLKTNFSSWLIFSFWSLVLAI